MANIEHPKLAALYRRCRDEDDYDPAILILELGGIILSALDTLTAAIADLQSKVDAENTELANLVSGLQAAQQQIADLQAQLAAGTPVSTEQLDAITTQLTTIAQSAADATSAAEAATAPPAPDPGPPAP